MRNEKFEWISGRFLRHKKLHIIKYIPTKQKIYVLLSKCQTTIDLMEITDYVDRWETHADGKIITKKDIEDSIEYHLECPDSR